MLFHLKFKYCCCCLIKVCTELVNLTNLHHTSSILVLRPGDAGEQTNLLNLALLTIGQEMSIHPCLGRPAQLTKPESRKK